VNEYFQTSSAEAQVSFSVGVVFGCFNENAERNLDPVSPHAFARDILFLSTDGVDGFEKATRRFSLPLGGITVAPSGWKATSALSFPRFGGHLQRRDTALGVIHGQTKKKIVQRAVQG
jgi:hypothetical protein